MGRPEPSLAPGPGGSRTLETNTERASTGSRKVTREGTDSWATVVVLALLGAILIVAPLPLGANRIWAWTPLEMSIFCLGVIWVVIGLGSKLELCPRSAAWLFAGMGLWLSYASLYLVPVPSPVAAVLAPRVYVAYHEVYAILGSSNRPYYLSLDRFLSLQCVLKYAMYTLTFFLATSLVTNRRRLKFLMYALLSAGVLQVSLALAARALHVDLVPKDLLDGHFNVLRGTFVNRNHFAAFLGMSASVGLGLAVVQLDRTRAGGTFIARILAFLDGLESPLMITACAVLLLGAGMIMSSSRGALGAFILSVIIVLTLSLVSRGTKARELILAWPLGIAALGATVWTGSHHLLMRLLTGSFMADERWTQWGATRDLVRDYWLTGAGPGAYQYAFTAYKVGDLRPLTYDYAHNDYLQLLCEQGIIGTVLLGIVVAVLLFILARSFMNRRDIAVRGALFASLTGMITLLIHSVVEFNFHIPANALYFWVLAGMGLAATRLDHQGHRRSSSRTEPRAGEITGPS